MLVLFCAGMETLYSALVRIGELWPSADAQSPISDFPSFIFGLKECGNHLRLTGDLPRTETVQ